ncbi:hypothetical protein [Vreelandella nanhaiensis]|uniref:Uncharacterized protein n=1 Tax=Vreelandella nanhaiensis TaxID=1258546 RepID=A0A433KJL9_9GAMM|nr:hypothetical protein [Halomonas nanhaiensis]RUR29898.1 hypothetical protein ELY38_14830 [Halomonas nanhaiensis]
MLKSRPFILLVILPLALVVVLAGAIFGGQAMSDSRVDDDIQRALAKKLDTSSEIELSQLQEVQYGYGICGLYRTVSSESGYASFFYDKDSENIELDINSRLYKSRCGLSSVC